MITSLTGVEFSCMAAMQGVCLPCCSFYHHPFGWLMGFACYPSTISPPTILRHKALLREEDWVGRQMEVGR